MSLKYTVRQVVAYHCTTPNCHHNRQLLQKSFYHCKDYVAYESMRTSVYKNTSSLLGCRLMFLYVM